MSLFRRQTEQPGDRTPEERERARAERAARRAARMGIDPAAAEPPPAEAGPADEPRAEEAEPPPATEVAPPPADEEPPAPEGREVGDPPPAPREVARPPAEEPARGEGAVVSEPPPTEAAPPPAAPPPAEPETWLDEDEPAVGQPTASWTPDFDEDEPPKPPQPATGAVAFSPAEKARAEQPTVAYTPDLSADASPPPPPPAPKPAPAPKAEGAPGEKPVPLRRARRNPDRALPPPPPPPGTPRGRARRGRILGVLALLLLVGLAWLVNSVFQPFKGEGEGQVVIRIATGSTSSDIGELLADRGVVDSSLVFNIRAALAGKRDEFRAGTYLLARDMSYSDAIDRLSTAPPRAATVNVTVPEGRARSEVAPLVRQAGITGSYVRASARAPKSFNPRRYDAPRRTRSLEGFLFPATYEMKLNASASQLVAKQLAAFKANIGKVDMRRARRRNLSTYDVLIIASMVEREAALPRERPIIAAVIHNRLRQGMRLQIDATIRYATNNWSRPIRRSELAADNPFNTYRNSGLPPGPIGSPGLSSIQAAAKPARVPYLFYVAKICGKGAHDFSATEEEFQRDVQRYNAERERRGGEAPTNC